jgi:hypothetical protein
LVWPARVRRGAAWAVASGRNESCSDSCAAPLQMSLQKAGFLGGGPPIYPHFFVFPPDGDGCCC